MQISNSGAFNYGQQGLQRSVNNLDQASAQVANASAPQTPAEVQSSGSDIRDGLVKANVSELEAKANAKVIGTADDMIGTIIDISV